MKKMGTAAASLAAAVLMALAFGCSDSDDDYHYTYNETKVASSDGSSSTTGNSTAKVVYQVTVSCSGDVSLGSLVATVSSGEVCDLTVDGYSCTGSGNVWLCQKESSDDDGEETSYVVTLSYSGGTWSYTAQSVSEYQASASDSSTVDVVLWTSDEEVLFVTANGIVCEEVASESEEGSCWIYQTDEGTLYLLEVQESDGTWSYTCTLYIADCITIVLPSTATSDDLKTLVSALSDYTDITLDMSAATEITSISYKLFKDCTALVSVVFPDTLTSIGDYAFCGCTGLTSLTIPSSVTSIGNFAFDGCTGLTSLTIPSSVTSIGNYVFYGCTMLESIELPADLETIEIYLFAECTSLTSILIPSKVTSIGTGAFKNCKKLATVEMYSSVKTIGTSAFLNCSSLSKVIYHGSESDYSSITFDSTGGGNSSDTGNSCFKNVSPDYVDDETDSSD